MSLKKEEKNLLYTFAQQNKCLQKFYAFFLVHFQYKMFSISVYKIERIFRIKRIQICIIMMKGNKKVIKKNMENTQIYFFQYHVPSKYRRSWLSTTSIFTINKPFCDSALTSCCLLNGFFILIQSCPFTKFVAN